jgi:hypothetical protein
MLFEVMTMPKVLCELGHKLTGAADSISVEEAISSLDHVRKAAFTDNERDVAMKPPVLLCDNLEPSSFFLHNQKVTQEEFKKGSPNLFQIPNLGVLGGCMMHTERCCFPVVILYSSTDDVMLVYCPRAPIAGLEADMYDSAFRPASAGPPTWEDTVLKEEAKEVMQWRREAAVATRNIGYDSIPKFMCGDEDIYITRHGVIPYLSLRAFENEGEYKLVEKAVTRAMCILPAADGTLLFPSDKADTPNNPILLASTFLTGEFACPREITERSPSKSDVEDVCRRPVITTVAFSILRYGIDNSTDHNGARINEYNLSLPWHKDQKGTFHEEKQKELVMHLMARGNKVTDVWQSINHDESYSLPAIMKRMGRSYITQPIVDGEAVTAAGDNVVRSVTEAIALAAFKPKDADFVLGTCAKMSESSMTVASAISVLGKCLTESQAIMVASRDQDGRFGQVKLVGNSGTIAQVNKHNFARLACLCTWVTTFIVDKGQVVSMLCVKDPEHVRAAMPGGETHSLDHQKLELREGTSAAQGANVAVVKGMSESMEKLTENLGKVTGKLNATKKDAAELKQSYDANIVKLMAKNESMKSSIKELTRKVDVLITRAMQETAETTVQPPACLNIPPHTRLTVEDLAEFMAHNPMPYPGDRVFRDEQGAFMHDKYDKAMRGWQRVKNLLYADVESDVVIVADDQDATVVSLKRSLEAIEALHKRMRK